MTIPTTSVWVQHNDEKTYLFYDIMDYPLPRQKEFFAYRVGSEPWWLWYVQLPTRSHVDEQFDEYVAWINKWKHLWKHIPFIEAVYVANSMTFNALKPWSDIDLFIVTNVKRLRWWRLCSVIIYALLRLKRTKKNFTMKFCLSFTVARDAVNLQELKLNPYDPYLVYWIAHLVPIYQEFEDYPLNIYKENSRIRFYLPNHPLEQVIDLWIDPVVGCSSIRRTFEKLWSGFAGDLIERLIKVCWYPILLWKRKRLGAVWKDCIISDKMLKFHYDKRKLYALKRKLAQKTMKKNTHNEQCEWVHETQ